MLEKSILVANSDHSCSLYKVPKIGNDNNKHLQFTKQQTIQTVYPNFASPRLMGSHSASILL